ncbi:hypothetical protein [Bradyrhizobium australafricanum]|uniref:hypothetical protein n=1 Tax=Bradyrhizobium australafricanum TaxID=2821406 RepID=UPI001CE24F7B|nr:hypothetical protein [Bradyrhizobium australafricanum]MCA6101249.1 hypothetical protein [Bradyrhizobium australafricanum]
MIARLALSVALPALIAAIGFGAEALNLGLFETLAAVSLIIGFAVAAAGWAVRSETGAVSLSCLRSRGRRSGCGQ